MKIFGLIFTSAVCLLSNPVATLAADWSIQEIASQPIVKIVTDNDGQQVQFTTVSLDRLDLNEPHMLHVRGAMNNVTIPMEQVEVKVNGKLVSSIYNGFLDLNLSPMMTVGRYVIEVSGTTRQSAATISLNFSGANTQVNQQSVGSGHIKQKLVINVQ